MGDDARENVVDTGASGGSLFSFMYHPPDSLSAKFRPRRYGRVEILLEKEDKIVDGVITKFEEFTADEQTGQVCWSLLINTSHDMSKYDQKDIALRLLS